MLVMIALRLGEEDANDTAASTFGSIAPLEKCCSLIYFVASSTVMLSSFVSFGVPKLRQTFSTPVRSKSISASSYSARHALVTSFSITALAPLRRVPCCNTGIPPPPAAITTCPASIRVLMASSSYISIGRGAAMILL